jgi:hypothetical protein
VPRHEAIVGFDFGHGEMALARTYLDMDTTVVLDVGTGRGKLKTAVAEHPKRGILLGDDALTAAGVTSLWVGFESLEIQTERVGEGRARGDADGRDRRRCRAVQGGPILATPLDGLHGLMWKDAFRKDLERAIAPLGAPPPSCCSRAARRVWTSSWRYVRR